MVFTACALQKPPAENTKTLAWEKNKLALEQIQSWALTGRIGIQLEKQSGSASLHWEQNAQDYVIRIIAPFGRGTVELRGNAKSVSMHDSSNQLLRASDPETLMQTYLGWQVPLSGLQYWIRGLPDPTTGIVGLVLDARSRPRQLSQSGWEVSYTSFTRKGELSLPKRLVLQNRKLKLNLFIRQWQLAP